MKKALAILLVLSCSVAVLWADLPNLNQRARQTTPFANPVTLPRDLAPMALLRTVTATDSPAIDGTNGTWTTALTVAKPVAWDKKTISLSVLALDATQDPALGQVAWKLWFVPWNGPMVYAGYGTWDMGTLEVSHNPENGVAIGTDTVLTDADATHYAWGELPVITADYSSTGLIASGTTNSVGELTFRVPNGCYGVYLEITDFAAASTIDALFVFMR